MTLLYIEDNFIRWPLPNRLNIARLSCWSSPGWRYAVSTWYS